MVVKPATAYNALAQAVNKKFPGTTWDGESAKSRVRTMKTKFHNVFSLCGGNVQEETGIWKLSDSDKASGILTLADKAQCMCPNWFSWLEWCGTDPNLSKHGIGDSGLAADLLSVGGDAESGGYVGGVMLDAGIGDGGGASDNDNDDGGGDSSSDSDANVGFGGLTAARAAQGDAGHVAEDEGDTPRAVSAKVAPANASADDDLRAQQKKRKEMLANMSKEEKKALACQEQKEKRQKENEDSLRRRSAVAAAAGPSGTASSPSSVTGSPFGKGGQKDWQAGFLVDRAKDEDARAERDSSAQIAVAKLQLSSADRHHDAELNHKRELLSFQQMQLNFQQQQVQLQMQMQQQQQAM